MRAVCEGTTKSGGQRVSQIEYMIANVGNKTYGGAPDYLREWDSNFTHAKWGISDAVQDSFAPWVCLGDENRQHQVPTCANYGGQLTRGGGAACFQQENLWKALNSFISKDECNDNGRDDAKKSGSHARIV